MSKVLIDRAVVEQALNAFEAWDYADEQAITALRAALEQPQVEQSSVVGVIGWKNHLPNSSTVVHWTALMPPLGTKLYTHPQPKREPLTPLTDEQIKAIINTIDRDEQYIQPALRQLARAIERAHGIGGEA